ncbi:hypothetical protein F5888DRAFT_1800340 [Russula emetica]|nr:hypothetical protein F5888DRAFT_1800340 [Russula emetica]
MRSVQSSSIHVGDLVLLEKNQWVPADLILLRTSDSLGTYFIRTDRLDGETDWKLRIAVLATQKLPFDHELLNLDAEIYADAPSKDIHTFIGTSTIKRHPLCPRTRCPWSKYQRPSHSLRRTYYGRFPISLQVNLDMDETVHRLNATSGVDGSRSDGNVGLKEMMHGLGLYTTDNKDPHHSSPHSSPPPTKTDPSKIASDAPPEGYKTFDIRVEWAAALGCWWGLWIEKTLASSYVLGSGNYGVRRNGDTLPLVAGATPSVMPLFGEYVLAERVLTIDGLRARYTSMSLTRLYSANTSLHPTQTKTRDLNLPKPGSPSTASLPNLRVVHKLQICSTRVKNGASSLLRLPRTKMRTTAAEAVSLSSQGIDVEEVEAGTESMTETERMKHLLANGCPSSLPRPTPNNDPDPTHLPPKTSATKTFSTPPPHAH